MKKLRGIIEELGGKGGIGNCHTFESLFGPALEASLGFTITFGGPGETGTGLISFFQESGEAGGLGEIAGESTPFAAGETLLRFFGRSFARFECWVEESGGFVSDHVHVPAPEEVAAGEFAFHVVYNLFRVI